MSPKKLREYLKLAQAIGASLHVSIKAKVLVKSLEDPIESGFSLGLVRFWHMLSFVGAQHEDGEGWEYFSAKEGNSIKTPRFMFEDGVEISLEEAKSRLQQKESGAAIVEHPAS
jgi:hypothetical protein